MIERLADAVHCRLLSFSIVCLIVGLSLSITVLLQSAHHNAIAILVMKRSKVVTGEFTTNAWFAHDDGEKRLISIQLLAEARYEEALALLESIPTAKRIGLDWMRFAIASAYLERLDRALDYVDTAEIPTDIAVQWGRKNWINLQGEDNPVLADLWFAAASRRSDGSAIARRDLGVWWLSRDPARAVNYLEPVRQQQPDDAWTNYLLARAYWMMGERDNAIRWMERAHELIKPRNATYCAELVDMYLARRGTGDMEQARSVLSVCLADFPQDEKLNHLQAEAQKP